MSDHPLRALIKSGFSDRHDRLWPLKRGDEEAAVTEYNMEVTGWTANLHGLVEYGQWLNAALSTRFEEAGWTVLPAIEDRR